MGEGEISTYHAFAQHGNGLLGSIEGPGCAACGSADSINQFDPMTNDLLSRTEHGTPTEYSDYGAFGHPGYLIRAAGTPDAPRTEYVYDLRIPGEADRRFHAKATTDCGEGDHPAVMG